jgi:hypothetical protein
MMLALLRSWHSSKIWHAIYLTGSTGAEGVEVHDGSHIYEQKDSKDSCTFVRTALAALFNAWQKKPEWRRLQMRNAKEQFFG